MWLVLFIASVWALLALHFDVRIPWLATPLAITYALGLIAVCILCRRKWLRPIIAVAAFALVLTWWLSLQPSNNRDWNPRASVLPHAEIAGSRVTIRNVRNCDYRAADDFDVRYDDRTFDLNTLQSVDLFLISLGSPHLAHTMISFGFADGSYICFSIETRTEKTEGYSAVKGFFRQFELIYLVGDERDLVRLRANYKNDPVLLYRLHTPPGSPQARRLFLDYIARINQLHDRPEWYNALQHNCTTSVRAQRAVADRAPFDWRMLLNGHLDEMLLERGMIDTSLSIDELRRRCLINDRARAADQDPDFSRLIRAGVPGVG